MKLWVFLLRRVILLVPVLVGVMTITFLLLQSLPLQERLDACYPFSAKNPPNNKTIPAAEQICGYNLPIWEQYLKYIGNIFTMQWGYVSINSCIGSQSSCQEDTSLLQPGIAQCRALYNGSCPVLFLISAWLPYTLQLAFLSLIIIIALSLPLGTYSAVRRNRPLDQGTRIFSFSGYALPGFLLASFVFIALFFAFQNTSLSCSGTANIYSVVGNWPPGTTLLPGSSCLSASGGSLPFMSSSGATSPTHLPLLDAFIYAVGHSNGYYWSIFADGFIRIFFPALTIAYGSIAGILRFVRNSTLEVMGQDFVRTARAKGVPERMVVKRHVGRTSLNATVTVLGLTFAFFLGGFAVTESVFDLYGVGRLFTYALLPPPDVGVLTASTLLITILVVVANIIVDVAYAYLDPRVRLG